MRGLNRIGIILSLALFASSSAWSGDSVSLSRSEAASIYSALEKAEAALKASSEEIARQARQLKTLRVFLGVLSAALAIETGALVFSLVKR